MAATKKITRKEIKQPDEFITLSTRGFEFARKHTRELVIGIACALLVGLAFWAWSIYSDKREVKASNMLLQAQTLLQPNPDETEAAQTATSEGRPDSEAAGKAIALLQDVVDNYRHTEANGLARILLGEQDYKEGNYDAAIATYEGYLKKTGRKPELTAMAQEGVAYSYEAKGDFSQALSYYEKLSRTTLATAQGWGYLGMARCYEKLGELQKAVDAYRALLTEYPQHPKAAEARANIARITQSLESEGSGKSGGPAKSKEAGSPPSDGGE